MRYFESLANTAKEAIEKYGEFNAFIDEAINIKPKPTMTIDEVLDNSDRMFAKTGTDSNVPW